MESISLAFELFAIGERSCFYAFARFTLDLGSLHYATVTLMGMHSATCRNSTHFTTLLLPLSGNRLLPRNRLSSSSDSRNPGRIRRSALLRCDNILYVELTISCIAWSASVSRDLPAFFASDLDLVESRDVGALELLDVEHWLLLWAILLLFGLLYYRKFSFLRRLGFRSNTHMWPFNVSSPS